MSLATTEHIKIPQRVFLRRQTLNWVRCVQVSLVILALVVWEVVGERLGAFLLAPPSSLPGAVHDLWRSGELQSSVLDSLKSLFIGFGIAAALGILLGFAMGWHRPTGDTLRPFVSAGYVTPISALVPVIIIWFGLGINSRLIVIVLFAIFEVIISTEAGVKNVDRDIIAVAQAFGASRRQLFSKVVFFAAMPYIFAGLRMGMSRSIKGMVIAELLFAVSGMGGAIRNAANYYHTDQVFVFVIVIVVLGVVLTACVGIMERWIVPWRE